MLKTINATRADAQSLIDSYDAWRRNEAENVLNRGNGGVFASEINILADQARRFAQRARELLSRSDAAAALTRDQIDDVTAIAEEMELAASEGVSASDPDTVFATLPQQKKRDLTQRVTVAREKSDLFRARVRGDLRKQVPPK